MEIQPDDPNPNPNKKEKQFQGKTKTKVLMRELFLQHKHINAFNVKHTQDCIDSNTVQKKMKSSLTGTNN